MSNITTQQSELTQWECKIIEYKEAAIRKKKVILYGAGAVVLVVLGPAILTGVLAGFAAIVAGAVGVMVVNFAPVFAKRVANAATEAKIAEANRHIAALKAEATRNPIETLENENALKHKDLRSMAKEIEKFGAEVQNLRDTIDQEGKFSSVMRKGKEALKAMELKLRYRELMYIRAVAAVRVSDEKLEELRALWRVAQAAQRADAASGETDETVMRRLLEETAIVSVNTQVNYAIAGLRTSMLRDSITEEDVLQLEQSKPDEFTLDVHATVIKEKEPVALYTISREATSRKE